MKALAPALFGILLGLTGFQADADPLSRPALPSRLAEHSPITAIAPAGEALVAVGQRGHVLRSTDAGRSWTQSPLQVSSDLTAAHFPDPQIGFAVGHDGVVVRSEDGGKRWDLILDGNAANRLNLEHMQGLAKADDSSRIAGLLAEAERNVELGPDKPWLDVWFADTQHGWVVGAYNLILHTSDGGKSWESWFDRTDNPRLLNLHAIRAIGERLWIAGEGGLLLRLDDDGQRFAAVESPYEGSWFGLLALPDRTALAFGMRAHAYRLAAGETTWQPVDTKLHASIVGAARDADDAIVLLDQSGALARSRDGGQTFESFNGHARLPAAALAAAPGALIIGGPRGLRRIDYTGEK